MPEVAEQQGNAQEQQQQEQKSTEQQQAEQKEGKTYTQAEWDARQAEFDSKASKIRRNAEREAERRLLRDVAARQQGGQQQQQVEKKDEGAELKEPKREDFGEGEYEKYLDARADWRGRVAAREERQRAAAEERDRKAAESVQARQAEFKQHAKKVMEEVPDFAETIENAEGVMITPTMADAIEEAGVVGAHILYRLAKDPDESERISKLSPTGQLREIGKLEAKVEAELASKKDKGDSEDEGGDDEQEQGEQRSEQRQGEDAPERGEGGRFKATDKKETRKAPEPIEPIAGRGGNNTAAPSDKDPPDVWLRKREAEVARERKVRRAG